MKKIKTLKFEVEVEFEVLVENDVNMSTELIKDRILHDINFSIVSEDNEVWVDVPDSASKFNLYKITDIREVK